MIWLLVTGRAAVSAAQPTCGPVEENAFLYWLVDTSRAEAIALALRTGSRILGADEVLEAGGVAVPDEDEDEVEKFREFLDHVTPEDFEAPGPGQ